MRNLFRLTLSIFFSCFSVIAQCDDLVLDLPFNGNAQDLSGNNNHGTPVGCVLVDDRFGNANSAYYFDGIDDKISIPDDTTLDLAAEWTIAAWVKPENGYGSFQDNHVSIVDKWGNGGVGNAAYTMSIHTGGYMEGFTYNGTNGTYTYTNSVVPEDEWTQLVITRSNDNSLRYYLNGILDTVKLNSVEPQNSTFPLQIGMVGSDVTEAAYPFSYRFHGSIDDVKIYKCALSSEEITELLNVDDFPVECDAPVLDLPFNGNAQDLSGNNNHGTPVGCVLVDDRFGNANSAYYFDGVDDKISIPDDTTLDLAAEWTILAWVKPENGYGSFKDNHVSIVDKWGNGGVGNAAYTMSIHTGGYMEGFTYNGTNGTYTYTNSVVPEDEWTQLVITRSNDNSLRYYLNGILDTVKLNSVEPQNSTFPLQIGMVGSDVTEAAYPFSYRFHGSIDDVKIYKCALSSEEITQLLDVDDFGDMSSKNSIRIYPNPISSLLNIQTELSDFSITLINIMGQVVLTEYNTKQISVSQLLPGIYFAQILDENGNIIESQRVVKE